MEWAAGHKWGRWLAKNVFTPLDKLLYRITKGKRGLSPTRAVCVLETTGRKTGKKRQVPVLFLRDGDRFWVMASNYGQERHPGWSANLLADPQARITIGSYSSFVTARLASDQEKKEKWPELLELYPSWKSYAEWTDRNFRLFCLEPSEDQG